MHSMRHQIGKVKQEEAKLLVKSLRSTQLAINQLHKIMVDEIVGVFLFSIDPLFEILKGYEEKSKDLLNIP